MSDGIASPLHPETVLTLTSIADFENIKRLQQERNAAAAGKKGSRTFDPSSQRTDDSTKASLTESFDTSLYERDGVDKYAGYNTSIAVDDTDDADMFDDNGDGTRRLVGQYTASRAQVDELSRGKGVEEEDTLLGREKSARISDRETDYQKRRLNRGPLTPTRADPFAENRQAGVKDAGASYRETMAMRELEKEEERVKKIIDEQRENGDDVVLTHAPTLRQEDSSDKENKEAGSAVTVSSGKKRKKQRWDVATDEDVKPTEDSKAAMKKSRWDETPVPGATVSSRRSRWDQAPSLTSATPVGQSGLATPMHPSGGSAMLPSSFGTDISGRNAPLSDEELDAMLPSEKEGYKVLEPPPGYEPINPQVRRLNTPAPAANEAGYGGFMMQEPEDPKMMGTQLPDIPGVGELQFLKAEDMAYFGKLVDGSNEDELSVEELKERKIMRLVSILFRAVEDNNL